MSAKGTSRIARLVDRLFPRMPDFYSLIDDQCNLTVETMEEFVKYMGTGDPACADKVRELEKRGDLLKARNYEILDKAFATPMDREDIFRAIVGIDQIINYAKTSVREMEVLELRPDKYMLQMAMLLQEGAIALQQGFRKLSINPAAAEAHAQAARKAERRIEKVYRRAIAELFSVERITGPLATPADDAIEAAMVNIIEIFKHREIYRHLSNGGDRLAHAGDNLHDIVVKIA